MKSEDELACHELLLLLAGRLPDIALWRFRDWLGEGQLSVLARTLPKSLLRHGIGLDQREHGLLAACLVPHGADVHQVSATLRIDGATRPRYTFTESPSERANVADSVSALLDAALRGRPDVGDVRATWRRAEGHERGEKRVLLVTAVAGWPRLTGELQRVLRVLGDDEPSIEVLPPNFDMPEYHREALANSRPVSVGAVGAAR
ncbi:hypothetical protein [Haloechinothrix salitolerans]|uniref:Uncharacterized protein n=1 Tax=Haloechinothrix salitolerans TaxID=926830 RepID=A0ABW2BRC7_9PSEU